MATFKVSVLKHQQRRDEKFPVSIRITWQRESAYIKTAFYVTQKQLTKDFEIKDAFINKELASRIAEYENIKVRQLGQKINQYTAKQLAEYFSKSSKFDVGKGIDLISYAADVVLKVPNKGTAGIYQTVLNSIVRFIKTDSLLINAVDVLFLKHYEAWLTEQGLTKTGINLYMRTLRALFNKARNEFNDEDKGEINIAHYPFKKYQIPEAPITEKRSITVAQIQAIRDAPLTLKRDVLARDVFMLSFYLAGINSVDMYFATKIEGGRLGYERQKTRSRRQDNAYISLLVEPEALPIMAVYRDNTGARLFNFYQTYATPRALNSAINKGLKRIATQLNFTENLEFYAARHSWATIARNDCHIAKDDVHEALNHASAAGMKVTDIYIKKDWGIIDRANRKVLDLIKNG